MRPELEFFPPQASTFATSVDNLYIFFLLVCGFFGALVFFVTALFAARYRRAAERYDPNHKQPLILEIGWAVPPAIVVAVLFVWGAKLYISAYTPPPDAYEIFVTGKQWMWKIQHPSGKKEINELHVPIHRPIQLTMTSEDVIHSFYVPAFRLKRDVLPGRYTSMWFEATQVGEYHLFCAEFCGHGPLPDDRKGGRDGSGRVRDVAHRRGGRRIARAGGRTDLPAPGVPHLPRRRGPGARDRCSRA